MAQSTLLLLKGKLLSFQVRGERTGWGQRSARCWLKRGPLSPLNSTSESSASRAEVVASKIRDNGSKAIVLKASVNSPAAAKFLVQKILNQFKTDHIEILGMYYSVLQINFENVTNISLQSIMPVLAFLGESWSIVRSKSIIDLHMRLVIFCI